MNDTDVLCVRGGGVAERLHKHAGWLGEREERRLLVVKEEADADLLLFADHPRVRMVHMRDDEEVIKQKLWELLFLRFSYEDVQDVRAKEMFAKIERLRSGIHLVASDFRDMGAKILSNYLQNFLLPAKQGSALFGRFEDRPALICGAGPSLEADALNLRAFQDRALIFAGGSALAVLSTLGVEPTFMAHIDPDPPLERFALQRNLDIPFFYQSRVAHEILAQVRGPKLWIPDSGGYPLDAWMHAQIGVEEHSFEGGWNVATFCIALAQSLGCNPIIFAGLELSCAGEEIYASGVSEKVGEGFIEETNVEGQKVHTKPDWLMARSWLEEFIAAHPETTFINTTPQGLAIQGAVRMSLAEVLNSYRACDAKSVVRAEIAKIDMLDKSTQVVDRVKASFARCEMHTEALLTLCEKNYPTLPSESGQGALLEVELEEEVAYQQFLEPLWNVWKPLFVRRKAEHPYLHKLLFLKNASRHA